MINTKQNNGNYLNNPPTEIVEKVKNNVVLKNSEYEIVLIPDNIKINSSDGEIPRVLYENKSKRYCYQLDYNTFIFLYGDYEEYKKMFKVKDNRLLFIDLGNGKLGGRGLNQHGNELYEVYRNYEEYIKKNGEKDSKGEFKTRGDEIKIYENLENYFKRKCRIYPNIKDFENNVYLEYEDIYQYYLPEYKKIRLKKYGDLLSNSKEIFKNIEENIKRYHKKYNSFFDVKNDIYFDELHNLKFGDLNGSELKKKVIENYVKISGKKNSGIYLDGTATLTICSISDDIENLLKINNELKIIKKEIEVNLFGLYNGKEEPNLELTKLKEDFLFLWNKFYDLQGELKEILEKFIIFFKNVVKLPIFLDSSYVVIEKLEEIKDKVIKYIKLKNFNEYFYKINNVDDVKLKNKLNELKSYLEILPDSLDRSLNQYLSSLKINWEYFREIGFNIKRVNNLFMEFKDRFYSKDKLEIPENINNLTDEDRKQLGFFIIFMGKIIERLNKLLVKLPEKILLKNKSFKNESKGLEGFSDELVEFLIFRINLFKENSKKSKDILLTSLEKFLSLYKNLIVNDFVGQEYRKDINSDERYYEDRDLFRKDSYSIITPLTKEKIYDFLEQVKKYIGEDKVLYKNLCSLCDDLIKTIKSKYTKRRYSFSDELISVKTIKDGIEKYKKYIENVNKFNNKKEFLKNVGYIHTEIVPNVLQYEKFMEEFKDNEEVDLFKNEVYDDFKNILVKSLENIVKNIKELYLLENSNKFIVKDIEKKLSFAANYSTYFSIDNFKSGAYEKIIDIVDCEIKRLDELKKTEVEECYIEKINILKNYLENFKKSVESAKEYCTLDILVKLKDSLKFIAGKVEILYNEKNLGDLTIEKLTKDLSILK